MKRIVMVVSIAFLCAGLGWAAYRIADPPRQPLSKFVPAGPLLVLEAKDFSSLVGDWNSSQQKKQWVKTDNYEIFSRSRLFLRLQGASDQFAAAAGLPPDMDFLTQVAGEHSLLALYDIGNLQFLYITYLPSAKAMQTTLWQTRAKFEPRNAGGTDFYFRRDQESKREVAFAVVGDYLVLATREDLMAGALLLMSGKPDRTVESDEWWSQASSAAGSAGDLRMALDLEKLVPSGYFRTYWVQQNITDLSHYSAAISDLFRSRHEYKEERVLIRKKEAEKESPEGQAAAAELAKLVPDDVGIFVATANPAADDCFATLETKLLAPHQGPAPASEIAPQVQLTSGEQGGGSDLETRIDQAPVEHTATQTKSALQNLLEAAPMLASLRMQATERDKAGVFVRVHSLVVLEASKEWDADGVQTAVADFVKPVLTASGLGVTWQDKSGYKQLDGLWPLAVAVRGKYLVVSNAPGMMEQVLGNFNRKSERKPADLAAGFNHQHEGESFARLADLVDRPNAGSPTGSGMARGPQFFSGNMASLSSTLAAVSAERIEVRSDGSKVRQTVTYEWSQ